MSEGRAAEIGAFVAHDATSAVDLGCVYGAFALRMAQTHPDLHVTGIDVDADAIAEATARAIGLGVSERVRFELSDVRGWDAAADSAVCIGSSHAFGGTAETLFGLSKIARSSVSR